MATGPFQPFASDEAHGGKDPRVLNPAQELGVESAIDRPRPGAFQLALRHMMYVIAVVAILLWALVLAFDSVPIGLLLILGSLVCLFAAVISATFIVARSRATRQDALLSVLAIAAEHGMPLVEAVLAFADQYRGGSYGQITNLAARITSGTSLPDALEQSRKLVSRDAILLARVGHDAGRLAPALRMAATARSKQLPIWAAISARVAYILGLLLVMQTITAFIMYFIIPKFEAIFSDFELPLPQITILVINSSHFLVRYGLITAWIPVFELALLVFLPLSFLSWSNYAIPLVDRLFGRRHTGLVLRCLALTVAGGKPISLGLSTLAQHYPTSWVRRKLRSVNEEVAHGADWNESLAHHRLIRPSEADLLKSATSVGNLAWALTELAATAERRLAIKVQMVIQTVFPVVVILLGTVVFLMAMAYFLPLVALITELTRQ